MLLPRRHILIDAQCCLLVCLVRTTSQYVQCVTTKISKCRQTALVNDDRFFCCTLRLDKLSFPGLSGSVRAWPCMSRALPAPRFDACRCQCDTNFAKGLPGQQLSPHSGCWLIAARCESDPAVPANAFIAGTCADAGGRTLFDTCMDYRPSSRADWTQMMNSMATVILQVGETAAAMLIRPVGIPYVALTHPRARQAQQASPRSRSLYVKTVRTAPRVWTCSALPGKDILGCPPCRRTLFS